MSALEFWNVGAVCYACGAQAVASCDVRNGTAGPCRRPCCPEHVAAVDGWEDTHRCASHHAAMNQPKRTEEGHPTT